MKLTEYGSATGLIRFVGVNKTKIMISIFVLAYLTVSMMNATNKDYSRMGHDEILESLNKGSSNVTNQKRYSFVIDYEEGTSGIVPQKPKVVKAAVKEVEGQEKNVRPPLGYKFTDKVVKRKVTKKDRLDYIARYHGLAQKHMKKHKIPASITLAQGILESNSGFSRLAIYNNNHFGIKCFSKTCSRGHCTNYTDDSHKDFFRVYQSVSGSYEGHSRLLKKQRYRKLFKLKITDYKGWAHGLRAAGYATDKRYAYKLIGIIERFKLYKYDKI